MILAGIDIGTNTLRLLIAEVGHGSFREIHSDRRITRLGQNLDRAGTLSREAGERSLKVLSEFTGSISRNGALHTAVIGTSALRIARNATEFIDQVKWRTGLTVTVVSGEEEARLTLLGVALALKSRRRNSDFLKSALVIDIGGGSTEIIIIRPGEEPTINSLPLGAVYLTERFIKHNPPSPEELMQLRATVRRELSGYTDSFHPDPASVFIGTAGTITTLAAIDQGLEAYDPARINQSVLTRASIDDIVGKLGSLTLESRRGVRGIEQGREDIILAGAVVTQEIMQQFRYTSMFVSDWGLREGIVLDLHEKLRVMRGC